MEEYRICINVFLSKNVLHLILHNIYEQLFTIRNSLFVIKGRDKRVDIFNYHRRKKKTYLLLDSRVWLKIVDFCGRY